MNALFLYLNNKALIENIGITEKTIKYFPGFNIYVISHTYILYIIHSGGKKKPQKNTSTFLILN